MLCLALPARRKVRKLDFQSEFSMSKIIRIFLIFFSLKNNRLNVGVVLGRPVVGKMTLIYICLPFYSLAQASQLKGTTTGSDVITS